MTITRVWQSGWELNSLASESMDTYGATGKLSLSSTAPKTGTYALRIDGSGPFTNGSVSQRVAVPSTTQLRVSFHVRFPASTQASAFRLFSMCTNAMSYLFSFNVNAAATAFQVTKEGGAQIGSDIPATANQYYHVGVDIKKDASAGWIRVYIDGVLSASFDGNTAATAITILTFGNANTISGSGYTWNSGLYAYWDDCYADDTTGELAPAVVPDRRFQLLTLTGNGSGAGWSGSDGNSVDNYLLVDEVPPNGDTDYVFASTPGLDDGYLLSNFTLSAGTRIQAVIPVASCKKMDSSDVKLTLGVRLTGAAVETLGSAQALPTAYGLVKFERIATKPGGGSWTESDVNDAEIRIQSSGTYV